MKSACRGWTIIATAFFLMSFCTPVCAQPGQRPGARFDAGGGLTKIHTVEIAPEFYSSVYKEPDIMQEKGMMGGIAASYAYRDGVAAKIEGRFFYGTVDYENSGKIDNIRDYGFEVRLLGGYDFRLTETLTITPSLGFGYRYLKDDMGGRISSTGAAGYSREANYYYSPIQMAAVQVIDPRWSVGAVVEYDFFWGGVQQSNLKDANSTLNNVRNEQNSGYGLRASLVVKRQTGWGFVTVEPFVRYWRIDNSEEQVITQSGVPIAIGWEPTNKTTEIGLRLGIGF
jgi:hypothetical protein